ncbi:ATP-binding cassette domain-containing protein [Trueperella pecoris]|uniref:ATP-binding cassette domain-containing protein n=1 Tax=Trueperella pecoris TaxID=2733571 RepID=UPI0020FFFDB0|nr:ABC transporter ATP-binding protein [Trueperella pecoris]
MKVELRDVTVFRGRKAVIDSVTVTLTEGLNLVAGENGAGKTTLLSALATLIPHRGQIIFDGTVVVRANLEAVRAQIGYLAQFPRFPKGFTVREALQYAAWLRMIPGAQTQAHIDRAVDMANISDLLDHHMGALSGGTARRVFLAMATLHRPKLLLLDEPTSGIDLRHQELLWQSLRSISRETMTIMTTHSVEEIVALNGALLVLRRGGCELHEERLSARQARDVLLGRSGTDEE